MTVSVADSAGNEYLASQQDIYG